MTKTSTAMVMGRCLWSVGLEESCSTACRAGRTAQGALGVPVVKPPGDRYQVSAFGFPAGPRGTGEKHGAYIVDTATGDVFLTTNGNKPVPVGSVADIKK